MAKARHSNKRPEITCIFACEKERTFLSIKYDQRKKKDMFAPLSIKWFDDAREALAKATPEEFLNYGINGDYVKWPDLGVKVPILDLWKKAFLYAEKVTPELDGDDRDDKCLENTWNASVQHNKIYKNRSDKENEKLKECWKSMLRGIAVQYKGGESVSDGVHCDNISNISYFLTNMYNSLLTEKGFNIGTAQKSLNLYLKYLWCLGEIETPPHCTVDRVILKAAQKIINPKEWKGKKFPSWTKCTKIGNYKGWIEKLEEAREAMDDPEINSLAKWELYVWSPQ